MKLTLEIRGDIKFISFESTIKLETHLFKLCSEKRTNYRIRLEKKLFKKSFDSRFIILNNKSAFDRFIYNHLSHNLNLAEEKIPKLVTLSIKKLAVSSVNQKLDYLNGAGRIKYSLSDN